MAEDNNIADTMKLKKSLSRIFIFGLLLLLFPGIVLSQNDPLISSSGIDTVKSPTEDSHHSLYTGIGYGSNMIYLGSTISQNQPYGYAALSYGYRNKFFATISSVHLSGMSPFQAFNIGSLYYSHVFNSWFDISSGIYAYQVAKSLTDTLFNSFLYADFTLGIDWKLIYSKFSAGLLLADENIAYYQIRNSRYFKTPEFFKKKCYLSFDPYVNLLFGTLLKAETLTETLVTSSSFYRRRGSTSTSTSTYTDYSKIFGLMEAEFGLPVAFNTDFMTLEAEISYILPVHEDPVYTYPEGFIFMLSGYFKIF